MQVWKLQEPLCNLLGSPVTIGTLPSMGSANIQGADTPNSIEFEKG